MKSKTTTLLTLLGLISLCVQVSHAATAEKEVEHIEIYGYKHLNLFKKEWQAKRFEFMDFFNERIDDPDLKFDCRKSRNVERNTRIKSKVCRSAYDWRIRQEQFSENFVIRGGGFIDSQGFSELGTKELKERESDKVDAIQAMLGEYPAFNKIYSELQDTQRKYKEAHKRTFGSLSNGAGEDIAAK